MKTIGVVCEGDRDYDMIQQTIIRFMGQEYFFLWLQPNPEFGTDLGCGWKGVLKWCEKHSGKTYLLNDGVSLRIDLLIIQIDGDVARREREVFCHDVSVQCEGQGHEYWLNCTIAKKNGCSQPLPPNDVCDITAAARAFYLQTVIKRLLNPDNSFPICITIPCDSMDSWIIAAFDCNQDKPEELMEPWQIITHSKDYFGVRISGGKKSKKSYGCLIANVCERWERVKAVCPQAKAFEQSVRASLSRVE